MSATPPKNLDKTARAKWRELLPTLPDQEPGTLDALQQYCSAWSSWMSATDDQDKIRWSRCCRQWAQELRLSPKSKTAKRTDEKDPLLKLLRRPAQ
jgi:phage terminase small subunit